MRKDEEEEVKVLLFLSKNARMRRQRTNRQQLPLFRDSIVVVPLIHLLSFRNKCFVRLCAHRRLCFIHDEDTLRSVCSHLFAEKRPTLCTSLSSRQWSAQQKAGRASAPAVVRRALHVRRRLITPLSRARGRQSTVLALFRKQVVVAATPNLIYYTLPSNNAIENI